MKQTKNNKTQTEKKYNGLRATKWSLYAGTYIIPLVPAAALIGVNYQEWFCQDKVSVGVGFGMLLVTIIITILGIAKKDKIVDEAVSKLFYLAGVMACWAVSLMFLASIAHEFGTMLLYTAIGLAGGATCDQVNKTVINEKIDFYKDVMSKAGIGKTNINKEAIKAQAIKDAVEEKKRLEGLR